MFKYKKNKYLWRYYIYIHEWIKKELGSPKKCDECGTTTAKKFEWANLSKKYLKETSDWKRLCSSCHRYLDGNKFSIGYTPWNKGKTGVICGPKKGNIPWNKGKKLHYKHPMLGKKHKKSSIEKMRASALKRHSANDS